jgi:TonB family protein
MKHLLKILLLASVAFITTIGNSVFAQTNNQSSRQISNSRKLISFPIPEYTDLDTGTVVVNIWVNKKGFIKNAQIDSLKSTTVNKTLLDNALKTAKRARFSKIDIDIIECGQLTYRYKQK